MTVRAQARYSLLLQAAGVNKDTPDPPGGAFDRDPDGTPNGVVRESARRVLGGRRAADVSARPPFEAQVHAYLRGFQEYAERGITSCAAAGAGPDNIRLCQAVRAAGSPVRLGIMSLQGNFQLAADLGLKSGFGDDMLRFTAIKAFQGNSLSGCTCWLSEEYNGT